MINRLYRDAIINRPKGFDMLQLRDQIVKSVIFIIQIALLFAFNYLENELRIHAERLDKIMLLIEKADNEIKPLN